jgi:integral membrane sensor domain MASE1
MSTPNLVRPDYSVLGLFKTLDHALAGYLVPSRLGTIAVLALSYFLAGELGLQLAIPDPGATAVWLPAGISLAAILLRGNRVWPGIFIGAFVVNATAGMHVLSSMGIALGSTLEALLAAYLVNKFAQGTSAFLSSQDVLRFVFFAGTLATALCATFGVCILCEGGIAKWTDFATLWRIWWVGDMLGTLMLTPFLVLLLGHGHHSMGLTELFEATVLLTGLSIVCVLNFGPPVVHWIPRSGLHYLCLPFLAWAAIRFCPLEAAGATLVLGGFAMWGSLHGYGLFANTAGLPFSGVGYVAVVIATTLTIAAALAQQRKYLGDVLRTYYILKEKYETEIPERTTESVES